jgi:hypothetical protein
MTDDKTLLHQCAVILLRDPSPENICWVSEALKLLAETASLDYRCDAIGDEYEQLVADARIRGSL